MGKLYQSDLEMSLGNNVIVTQMTQAVNWARKYSFFIYPFITACCGMEFMSVAGPRYDLDRFGAAFPRFSPRQADLLMVVGTISHKQAPILVKVYNQKCLQYALKKILFVDHFLRDQIMFPMTDLQQNDSLYNCTHIGSLDYLWHSLVLYKLFADLLDLHFQSKQDNCHDEDF